MVATFHTPKTRTYVDELMYDYLKRVKTDGGITTNEKEVKDALNASNNIIPLASTKLAILPSGTKAGKTYAQLPTDGTGDGTFTRNGTATYTENGVLKTAAANVPRIQDGAFLLEPTATQLYQLTETLATQTKTTKAASYTVSFWGSGTITFSGTYSGSLVGVDANTRVTKTFTATAGALVSTISGTVTKGQLELGTVATSYIPNTGTGVVTRVKDTLSNIGNVTTFNSEEGVLFVEMAMGVINPNSYLQISDGNYKNRLALINSTETTFRYFYRVGGVSQVDIIAYGISVKDMNKIAVSWKLNEFKFFINGVKVGEDLIGTVNPANTFNKLDFSDIIVNPIYGKVKQLKVFKRALSDEELTTLTS